MIEYINVLKSVRNELISLNNKDEYQIKEILKVCEKEQIEYLNIKSFGKIESSSFFQFIHYRLFSRKTTLKLLEIVFQHEEELVSLHESIQMRKKYLNEIELGLALFDSLDSKEIDKYLTYKSN